MSNYINQAMLEDRVGASLLAKFIRYDQGSDDYELAIVDIINRAESRVDGYLASRYEIPVPTSGLLEEMALATAEYELYRRSSSGVIPEKIKDAYESVLKDLRSIANGSMELGGAVDPTPSGEVTGLVVDSADGMFDPDEMKDAGW